MPRPKSAARERLEAIASDRQSGKALDSANDDATAAIQEQFLQTMQCARDLIQAHDFSIEKWSKYWSLEVYTTGMLSLAMVSAPLRVSGLEQTRSLDEVLGVLRHLAEKYPEWHTEVLDQNCMVDLGRKKGHVHASFETSGIFPGILRREISIFEFAEQDDGVWRVVGLRTMSGEDGGIKDSAGN